MYAVMPSELGEALCAKMSGLDPRQGGSEQSYGGGRNGPPAGKPPSRCAAQSSVSTGLDGSVTSTSWKSPSTEPKIRSESGSENGEASRAKTPSGRFVSESSCTPKFS